MGAPSATVSSEATRQAIALGVWRLLAASLFFSQVRSASQSVRLRDKARRHRRGEIHAVLPFVNMERGQGRRVSQRWHAPPPKGKVFAKRRDKK